MSAIRLRGRLTLLRRDLLAYARCVRHGRPASLQAHRRWDRASSRIWLATRDTAQLYAAIGFSDELRARRPDLRFVVSVPSPRHGELATAAFTPDDLVVETPCECPAFGRRALTARSASTLVVFGNSIPLALARAARACGVTVAWIGAEVSAASIVRWRRDPAWAHALEGVQLVSLSEAGDLTRLRELGSDEGRFRVSGSLKYDLAANAARSTDPASVRIVLRAAGIPDEALVLLGGSLAPGEDEVLVDAFARLRETYPSLCLVLVPRSVVDAPRAFDRAVRRGFRVASRSNSLGGEREPGRARADILVVDTSGELRALYAAATVAFVGRTLTHTVGSNILEPAAHGRAIVVGPHAGSFAEDFARFRDASAFVQVDGEAAVCGAVAALLADPLARAAYGARARAVVDRHTGTLRRTVTLFENACLAGASSPAADTTEACVE